MSDIPKTPRDFVLPPHANAETHRRIMESLRRMTPEEIFQTGVRSGIYSPDGTLLPPYADPEADGTPSETPRTGTGT
jgi:hypothetical protein